MDIPILMYMYIYIRIYIYNIKASWSTKRYLESHVYLSMHMSCARQPHPQGLHAVVMKAKQRNILDHVSYMMHNVYGQQLLTDGVRQNWQGSWPQISLDSQLRLWYIPPCRCFEYVVRGRFRIYYLWQDIETHFDIWQGTCRKIIKVSNPTDWVFKYTHSVGNFAVGLKVRCLELTNFYTSILRICNFVRSCNLGSLWLKWFNWNRHMDKYLQQLYIKCGMT